MNFSITSNSIAKQIAKRRWVRRLEIFALPSLGWAEFNGNRLYLDLTDWKGPSYHVMNWGLESYESTNLKFLLNYLSVHKTGGVLFDIGANIGIFSFRLAQEFPALQIRAFEPEPVTYICIAKTFKDAGFKNAKVFQLALSDQDGSSMLFSDQANHGGHSLNRSAIIDDGNEVGAQTVVATKTLDTFVRENGISEIDVIKLDVQRHEGSVLAGAMDSIRTFRPLVLMECYFEDITTRESPLLKPFLDQNYIVVNPKTRLVFDMDPGKLATLREGNESYCDLAFVPSEKRSFLSL